MGNFAFLVSLMFWAITSSAQLPMKKTGRIVAVNQATIYFEEYGQVNRCFCFMAS